MEGAVAVVLNDAGDAGRSLEVAGGEHALRVQRWVVRLEREEDTCQQTVESLHWRMTDSNR